MAILKRCTFYINYRWIRVLIRQAETVSLVLNDDNIMFMREKSKCLHGLNSLIAYGLYRNLIYRGRFQDLNANITPSGPISRV